MIILGKEKKKKQRGSVALVLVPSDTTVFTFEETLLKQSSRLFSSTITTKKDRKKGE